MKFSSHYSAKPSHYNKEAKFYDVLNEKNSRLINHTVEKILKKYKVKTVLDLTCGTGSQVFWLAKRGFDVVGCDINVKMLKIAKEKLKKEKLSVKFLKGDMRTIKIGKYDAVITIFNAIGHLTKLDFEKAMQNIYRNLKEGGLYIFDIFNLNYLMKDNHISELTIDWHKQIENSIIREIQYSTVNKQGILASYTTSYAHKGSNKLKVSKSAQTLQIYTVKQLKEMLSRNGFNVLRQCAIDGSKFVESKTDRMIIIAKRNLFVRHNKVSISG